MTLKPDAPQRSWGYRAVQEVRRWFSRKSRALWPMSRRLLYQQWFKWLSLGLVVALLWGRVDRLPLLVNQLLEESITPLEQVLQFPDLSPEPPQSAIAGFFSPRIWHWAAQLAARYGHFPYLKVNAQQLTVFSADPQFVDGTQYLAPEAATALRRMMRAAQQEGIGLVLVSGFRDLAKQQALFQERTSKYGSVQEAAKFVAPPGYSEHHTGYAIDLATVQGESLLAFGRSTAFRWMQQHASAFGFELSFPPHNPQGIDFEPWHWRFVGSPQAAKLFAAARDAHPVNGG